MRRVQGGVQQLDLSSLGFSIYSVMLFLFSGCMLLLYDVKGYKVAHMGKETKTAVVAGWMNVVIGLLSFAAYWLFRRYIF
jgi:hypothetical protein